MKSPYTSVKKATGLLWRCDVPTELLNDVEAMKSLFVKAIERSNTDLVKMDYHAFNPVGITLTAILADSHAVMHTWPEERFVMVEILTCGKRSEPHLGVGFLLDRLKPGHHEIKREFVDI